ncbi:HalOD1 output domain-containing protein [Haloferax namakaokahaiae]|uniref:HalOD1 output domain-containing protein n=1 Tax=Haloferax namakaokahaiae TaxID=1748331 RepID=A0ABD5ZH60_9EURY
MTLAQNETSSIVQRILETVADKEGVSVMDLEQPLYEVIDPEALAVLSHPKYASSNVRISFTYYGYEIDVDRTGGLRVQTKSGG